MVSHFQINLPDAPPGAKGFDGEVTGFCGCVGLCTLAAADGVPVGFAAALGLKGGAPKRSTKWQMNAGVKI